ncbi:hypothetical protein ETB97_010675 [Aspergillus alliaceus]|uniref:GST N-terminal domain-containing protein n=1 Tax=Petromyces alliaceus TaxID=209559 RepID=A0A8H5ZSK5_PETAA|nr:hypothetical protein ETB97_010675 [Aspergillus burnettii]
MTLTVHHLHISQSERIAGLCEELGIDYELKTYKRAPLLAPPDYKALHPQETAPVIQDGDLTLAESGACTEYICHIHAQGQLFLPPRHPAYADFLYWWHWSNGTFMPTMMKSMSLRSLKLSGDSSHMIMTNSHIMVVFVLTTLWYWFPYGLDEYENVAKYLQRVGGREAYQKAMRKCEPDLEPALGFDLLKKEE